MISEGLNIFDYQDYRAYLADWLKQKKAVTPGYSGAVFARRAGFSSHTLLGMVVRGQRNLSFESTAAFSRALGHGPRERTYFEKLVLFNQSKRAEDRQTHLEQLYSLSKGGVRKSLESVRDHAEYLKHWYVVAIRQLVKTEGFKADPDWISSRLKRKITRRQAQEAWEILLKLDMVRENPEAPGTYECTQQGIDVEPGKVDFAIRNFHGEYLDRAKEAIHGEPREERELNSLTLSVSRDDLPRLLEKVREFVINLNHECQPTAHRDTVVAVNFQALVLTAPLTKSQGENANG